MTNTVTVIGNSTREPEIRYLPSGASIVSFGLAVNRRWFNKTTNDWDEQTSFFDVKCWGELGEHVAESVPKGTRVVVTGRLEQSSWENDQGEKRSKVEIVADDVAPSLRWATATVTKVERSGGGQYKAPANNAAPTTPAAYNAEEPF